MNSEHEHAPTTNHQQPFHHLSTFVSPCHPVTTTAQSQKSNRARVRNFMSFVISWYIIVFLQLVPPLALHWLLNCQKYCHRVVFWDQRCCCVYDVLWCGCCCNFPWYGLVGIVGNDDDITYIKCNKHFISAVMIVLLLLLRRYAWKMIS